MGELKERKREALGVVENGNELDDGVARVFGGPELDDGTTASKGVCNGKEIGVEVDTSTRVGNGKAKGNIYAPLSFPSNFFVDPRLGKRGSPEACVQMLTLWSRKVSDTPAR